MATRATKAISIPPTLRARLTPSLAPAAAASITLTVVFSTSTPLVPCVSGTCVSGTITLAIRMAAGVCRMVAASRWPATLGMRSRRISV